MDFMRIVHKTLACVCVGLGLAGPARTEEQTLPDADELAAEFVALDEAYNDGRGYSESSNSASLGWGESIYLETYWNLYLITGQTCWWDKIIDHFDRMIANLSDHDGDGYLSWQTRRYSSALVRTSAFHNRGKATIRPAEPRIKDIKRAATITGHHYLLTARDADTLEIRDLTQGRALLGTVAFTSDKALRIAENVEVIITGTIQPGDAFYVETVDKKPHEYPVHQGMVLTPVARFIEAALARPADDPYHHKARAYLELIGKHFLEGNEKYWQDTGQGCGAYRFSPNPTQRYPNLLLPHNQYLALAQAWLILADVTGEDLYRTRAEAMARNFKRALREVDGAYVWNYADRFEAGQMHHSRVEDTSHGHIDIAFVVEAIRRGVVFTEADGKRFARTLMDHMWNGSTSDPKFGHLIDSPANPKFTSNGWVKLRRWDPRIAKIMATGTARQDPGLARTRNFIDIRAALKQNAAPQSAPAETP